MPDEPRVPPLFEKGHSGVRVRGSCNAAGDGDRFSWTCLAIPSNAFSLKILAWLRSVVTQSAGTDKEPVSRLTFSAGFLPFLRSMCHRARSYLLAYRAILDTGIPLLLADRSPTARFEAYSRGVEKSVTSVVVSNGFG
jgi:hypothetical protein